MELLRPFNYTKALHKSIGNSLFCVGLPVRLMNNIPKIPESLGQGLQSQAFKTCKGHLHLKCPEALSSFSGLKQILGPGSGFDICLKAISEYENPFLA